MSGRCRRPTCGRRRSSAITAEPCRGFRTRSHRRTRGPVSVRLPPTTGTDRNSPRPDTTKERRMPVFKLPLSGDVVQTINPFTAWMSPVGSQFSLINITLGQSTEPKVEEEVLSDVGTYGKQL